MFAHISLFNHLLKFLLAWLALCNYPHFLCYRDDHSEHEQQSLAVMLMVVVIVFVFCNVLAMVSNMLDALKIDAVPVTQVSNLLVTINSSINIFIYCAFGKRFRTELGNLVNDSCHRLTKPGLCSKNEPNMDTGPKQICVSRVYYSSKSVTVGCNRLEANDNEVFYKSNVHPDGKINV